MTVGDILSFHVATLRNTFEQAFCYYEHFSFFLGYHDLMTIYYLNSVEQAALVTDSTIASGHA